MPWWLAVDMSLSESASDALLLPSLRSVGTGCYRGDGDVTLEQRQHAIPDSRAERCPVQQQPVRHRTMIPAPSVC